MGFKYSKQIPQTLQKAGKSKILNMQKHYRHKVYKNSIFLYYKQVLFKVFCTNQLGINRNYIYIAKRYKYVLICYILAQMVVFEYKSLRQNTCLEGYWEHCKTYKSFTTGGRVYENIRQVSKLTKYVIISEQCIQFLMLLH